MNMRQLAFAINWPYARLRYHVVRQCHVFEEDAMDTNGNPLWLLERLPAIKIGMKLVGW